MPATAQNVAAAQAIYADRCARCHGDRGAGDGPDASLYKPLPASLTADTVRQTSDAELFWKIGKGRRPMPGYENELTAEQRWQLVNLLRTSPRSRGRARCGASSSRSEVIHKDIRAVAAPKKKKPQSAARFRWRLRLALAQLGLRLARTTAPARAPATLP